MLVKTLVANYILEGIYFYSGFMFLQSRDGTTRMPGSAQEIRYINRDENTHLWLFRKYPAGNCRQKSRRFFTGEPDRLITGR